jgi:hypothetical protein
MQDKERAIFWIIRYISFIIPKREYLAKPFRNATEEYIRSIKCVKQKGQGITKKKNSDSF